VRARGLLRHLAGAARVEALRGDRSPVHLEPGEQWFWNFETGEMFEEGPKLAPPHHHPLEQGTPGPRGRVPRDWEDHIH
jgi:hypothetical protein